MAITIAGIEVKKNTDKPERLSMLLWGPAGVGKTTLAATAPGRKLLLSFDPDGATSITNRDDVFVADMTQLPPGKTEQVGDDNPWSLRQALEGSEQELPFDTLIVDSLTSFADKALMHGVASSKGATVARPSLQGFGYRTALSFRLVVNLLRLTSKMNKHIIFIAHEGAPEMAESGGVLEYPLGLGGQLPSTVPAQLSEVWYMLDSGTSRTVMIRPGRMRKVMKTRMFSTSGAIEFPWKYDADKQQGDGIATWFDAWVKGGKQKLPLPK